MATSQDFFDQRLSALKDELKTYGREIVEHVTSLYGTNSAESKFDLKNDAFSMLSVLQIDVAEILKESQERREYRELHAAELDECSNLAKILSHISSLIDRISECENLISKISLIPACEAIEKIHQLLSELPGPSSEIGSGKVCSILRKETKLLHCRLSAKLTRILKEQVQFSFGRVSVHRELKGVLRSEDIIINEPIALRDVWTAVTLSGRTDEVVEGILRDLWTFILRPLWREKKPQAPRSSCVEEHHQAELHLESVAREGRSYEQGKASKDRAGPFADLGACKMPLPHLLDYVGQVFDFLWTEVLCCNEKAAESVALKLSAAPISLVQALIDTISHQLPKSEGELGAFRRALEGPCRLLETRLSNFGFLDVPEEDEAEEERKSSRCGPLSAYIADLPSIYADLRRKEILRAARELVLSDYHNTMMAAGDAAEDELSSAGDVGDPRAVLDQSVSFALQRLKFDSCQTSLAACRLLKLVHEVMRQASSPVPSTSASVSAQASATAQVAHVLFQSARDCLEMFMAIVPMHFAEVIDSVPRMGAVFYNDCLYIAHNCTLITHKYRHDMARIDPVLELTVGFADYIPRFRSLGDQCLVRHVEEQSATVAGLVRRINIDPEGEDGGLASRAEGLAHTMSGIEIRPGGLLRGGLQLAGKIGTKIGLGEDAVEGRGASLGGGRARGEGLQNDDDAAVLVRRHLERLSAQWLGVLQDCVYARVMGHLLEVALKEAMLPVLTSECIAEAAGAEISRVYRSLQQIRLIFPTEGKDDEAMQRVCGCWRKFQALADLLEYSLSEVAEWLPRKKFSAFTGNEMSSLLRALFEDTPRRQAVLASILEMSS